MTVTLKSKLVLNSETTLTTKPFHVSNVQDHSNPSKSYSAAGKGRRLTNNMRGSLSLALLIFYCLLSLCCIGGAQQQEGSYYYYTDENDIQMKHNEIEEIYFRSFIHKDFVSFKNFT